MALDLRVQVLALLDHLCQPIGGDGQLLVLRHHIRRLHAAKGCESTARTAEICVAASAANPRHRMLEPVLIKLQLVPLLPQDRQSPLEVARALHALLVPGERGAGERVSLDADEHRGALEGVVRVSAKPQNALVGAAHTAAVRGEVLEAGRELDRLRVDADAQRLREGDERDVHPMPCRVSKLLILDVVARLARVVAPVQS